MTQKTQLSEYRHKLKIGLVSPPERLDPIEKAKRNLKSLRLAVNAKCYDCTCGQRQEVKNCTASKCLLYSSMPWQKNKKNNQGGCLNWKK